MSDLKPDERNYTLLIRRLYWTWVVLMCAIILGAIWSVVHR